MGLCATLCSFILQKKSIFKCQLNIILSGYYNDTESVDKSGSTVYFDYEICKSKYQWVIDKTFETYLKRYEYFECEAIKDDNWDALVAYKSDKLDDGYLLKYKDRVVSVYGSIDFSKKNIDFIKEKCINW